MISKKDFSPLQLNTIRIFFFIGLVKMTGFLRDAQIANYFGITKATDLYYYSLIIPFFLYNLISGSFNIYFIPAYSKIKSTTNPDQRHEYTAAVFLIFTFALIIISLLCNYFLNHILLRFNSQIAQNTDDLAYFFRLCRWSSVFFFFYSLSSLFISLLQAEHRYATSIYPQIFIPLGSVFFILLKNKTLGPESILQGATLGALISCATLYFASLKLKIFSNPFRSAFRPSFFHTDLQQFFFLLLTYLLPGLIHVIDRQIAINLGEGQITVLNYGVIIPDGLYEICSVGLGIASFSYFSQWYSENKINLIVSATRKVIALAVFFILPVCSFLYVFAQPILSILFKRGAFSYNDTLMVMAVLKTYCPMLLLTTVILIGQRIISASRKNNALLVVGIFSFIIKIGINIPLTHWLGVKGLPMATNIMFVFTVLMIFIYLHKNGFDLFNKKMMTTIIKGIIFSMLIFSLFLITFHQIPGLSDIEKLMGGAIILSSYFIAVWLSYKKYRVLGSIPFTP